MARTRNPNLGRPHPLASPLFPIDGNNVFWTGKPPLPGICPGVSVDGRIHSLPQIQMDTCSRTQVQDYFDNAWTLTETLLSALSDEEDFLQPPWHNLRHPFIFYYIHPAVLYVNKLRVAGLLNAPLNAYYEALFETGVDEMSWDDMSKNEMEWPRFSEATAYRRTVYETICRLIQTHPGFADGHAPITASDPLYALFLGFEHERIHIETSSVLMREFPLSRLRRPAAWPEDPPSGGPAVDNPLMAVDGGVAFLGKPEDSPLFGWDNEYGQASRPVPPFEATTYLIQNGEFLEFVRDGGYGTQSYWTEDGWRWRQFNNAKCPAFWISDGPQGQHQYLLRTLFRAIPLPLSWPAVVNWYEADAFRAWRSRTDATSLRLLSEAEHRRLVDVAGEVPMESANLHLRWGCEGPVHHHPQGAFGDVRGNLWQWCEDHFHPLDGFAVHPYYEDFSTPCFDGEHQMILGGSFVSTGNEATLYSRFHFRPHFFQHAGFRLVCGGQPTAVRLNPKPLSIEEPGIRSKCDRQVFDWERLSSEWRDLLQGEKPARSVLSQLNSWMKGHGQSDVGSRASLCHIGAGTGQLTLALRPLFTGAVVASEMDPDAFVVAMERCKSSGIDVRRADPCCLPPEWAGFDWVLLDNLLGHVASPAALLDRLGGGRGLVRPGGFLVVLTDFVAHQKVAVRVPQTPETLSRMLGTQFALKSTSDLILPEIWNERHLMLHRYFAGLWHRTGSPEVNCDRPLP